MKVLSKKQKTFLLGGLIVALLLIGGTAYAYFNINMNIDKTNTTLKGSANGYATPTIKSITSNLYLNLDAILMSEDNVGKTYFANADSLGKALVDNPNYLLATITGVDKNATFDCTYNYKVTASVSKSITDGSDGDIKVVVGDKILTLKEILGAGTDGIIVTGKVKTINAGDSISLNFSSSVTNTANTQDNLIDNSYIINIEPYNNGDTKSFNCKLHEDSTLTDELIASGTLWQSNLEGDGYRFTGSGTATDSTSPNNFVCFGTIDKNTCTANPGTYMYRIIGVFADENGDNHVKLIKYTQLLSKYSWGSDISADTNWEDSDLYKGLNGSYFLTNGSYSYMQDEKWLNKITDWKWSAVKTKTYDGSQGPNYFNITTQNIYLHEMNRAGKQSTIGEWTTPTAKIGLMYLSDYVMSLGAESLSYTISSNYSTLKTGWLHQSNNDVSVCIWVWTLPRYGAYYFGEQNVFAVSSDGMAYGFDVLSVGGVSPVFYLSSDIESSRGAGSLSNPYILKVG